jgi:hypothetical protein
MYLRCLQILDRAGKWNTKDQEKENINKWTNLSNLYLCLPPLPACLPRARFMQSCLVCLLRPDGSLASWRTYGAPPLSLSLLYEATRRTCDFRSGCCVQVKKKSHAAFVRSGEEEKSVRLDLLLVFSPLFPIRLPEGQKKANTWPDALDRSYISAFLRFC